MLNVWVFKIKEGEDAKDLGISRSTTISQVYADIQPSSRRPYFMHHNVNYLNFTMGRMAKASVLDVNMTTDWMRKHIRTGI